MLPERIYMKRFILLVAACVIAAPAFAQNVATVNVKPITQKAWTSL